jgi:predicted enzyme related to lactoylglutathione lyase
MSDSERPRIGTIGWVDLTVPNAEPVRDFYASVTGWRPERVPMHGYDDFNMLPPDGDAPAAGICHARGGNAALPAAWLIYITVEDVDVSAGLCKDQGGRLVIEPRNMGEMGRFCVIEDPAGAVVALFSYYS